MILLQTFLQAHVAQAIVESEKYRKFILVQMPEKLNHTDVDQKAGIDFCNSINVAANIAEIGKERIRRVCKKNKEKSPEYEGDLGFKVFKLDSTNIKPWDMDFDMTEKDMLEQVNNIKDERSEEDVLYEVLLKYGLDLTLPITKHSVGTQTIYDIGMGALIICLSDDITIEVVEGIVKLKDELMPEIMRVVFKDSGFSTDAVKTNAVQVLNQAGVNDVRSL